MAKRKVVAEYEQVADPVPSETVHIERGPWDIDPTAVTHVEELSPSEVLVLTAGASYRLTREEAAPFMD